jgi:predicted DNA binding CopG/RHH family protein
MNMASTAKVPKLIPNFESEDEEFEFWETHDPEEYFEETPIEDIVLNIKPPPMKAVTLRMAPSLVAKLKETAAEYGVGYQTLARELLKQALRGLPEREPPVSGRARAVARSLAEGNRSASRASRPTATESAGRRSKAEQTS